MSVTVQRFAVLSLSLPVTEMNWMCTLWHRFQSIRIGVQCVYVYGMLHNNGTKCDTTNISPFFFFSSCQCQKRKYTTISTFFVDSFLLSHVHRAIESIILAVSSFCCAVLCVCVCFVYYKIQLIKTCGIFWIQYAIQGAHMC